MISYFLLSSFGSFEVEQEIPTCTVNAKLFYALTFDNVNQKIGVRHHVHGKKNQMLNRVQTYATLERIGSTGLPNVMPSSETVRNIPIAALLPDETYERTLHDELTTLVSRILTTHVPVFAGLDAEWSLLCLCQYNYMNDTVRF